MLAAKDDGKVTTSRFASSAVRIDLRQMSSVVEYPARDMTITVEAGMPIGRLRDILAEEHQQLPIDCHDPQVSIGAMVASNMAGSRQFGYGTLRDYLIGLEAVDGQGRIFHAGGRVVKNVAGYDLCRLMVGSRGALGVLTQLTFKVKPIPEQQQGLQLSFSDEASFDQALERLNVTAATPVVMDFTCTANGRSLWLAVEGSPETCAWQIQQLQSECPSAQSVLHDAVTDYCNASEQQTENEWRIRCLPSRLTNITSALLKQGVSSRGYAGSGHLFANIDSASSEQLSECRTLLAQFEAHVIDWHDSHPSRDTNAFSVGLRKTFDPHSLFQS